MRYTWYLVYGMAWIIISSIHNKPTRTQNTPTCTRPFLSSVDCCAVFHRARLRPLPVKHFCAAGPPTYRSRQCHEHRINFGRSTRGMKIRKDSSHFRAEWYQVHSQGRQPLFSAV